MNLQFHVSCLWVCLLILSGTVSESLFPGPASLSAQTLTATVSSDAVDSEIGVITRPLSEDRIAITVSANDPKVENLLRLVFDAHGAFTLKAGLAGAQYALEAEIRDAAAIAWSASVSASGADAQSASGAGFRPAFTGFEKGENLIRAAYQCADSVIEKITGEPGFFAGRIAFISDREGAPEVYFGDLFFHKVVAVTRDRALCLNPQLSPDGKAILYTSYYRNGFPDIYKLDLARGQRDLFAGFRGTNSGARFSPDGKRVAMVLSGAGNAELYIADSEGYNLQRLTETNGLESGPSWSPDGRHLVFTSDELGKPQLFQIEARTGGLVRRVPVGINRYCAEPVWNPLNEEIIAFTVSQQGEFEIALFDASLGRSMILTQGPGDAVEPCWMRDGRHLIYTRRTASQRQLMLLDTYSGKERPLHTREFGSAGQCSYAYPGTSDTR